MKLVTGLVARLVPLVAGAGVSVAWLHTTIGLFAAVASALYTAFLAGESFFRLLKALEEHRAKKRAKSPRTKSDE